MLNFERSVRKGWQGRTSTNQDSEVARFYLSFLETAADPPKILRGFERIYVQAAESKTDCCIRQIYSFHFNISQ
jgi:hypothetical protein